MGHDLVGGSDQGLFWKPYLPCNQHLKKKTLGVDTDLGKLVKLMGF